MFLEISQNSQENTCARVSFSIKLQASACNFIKKETLAQMFYCEYWEVSKNAFFIEHLWPSVSNPCFWDYSEKHLFNFPLLFFVMVLFNFFLVVIYAILNKNVIKEDQKICLKHKNRSCH